MTSNKKDDEIFQMSQKNIRQNILLFKEEVLKDIKTVQKDFSNKFNKMQELLKDQINLYELKVSSFEQRINNLSNLISSDRALIQKIEEFNQFKDEAQEKLITDSIKITNLETDFKMNIKNIENILSSSVIYPGLIGYSARFKSFHNFIDYTLTQLSEFNLFKEKNILDLVPYKKKIDETLDYIKIQIDHTINSSNQFTIKMVDDCEQRLKSLIQLYDDRLQDARVENAHYSVGLEKKSEELSRLIKNVYEIKADIYKKLKDEVNNVKVDQKTLLRLVNSYKKEFGQIKDKFLQLSEFIRDVRFRVNLAPDIQKKEFISMSKNISFKHRDSSTFNNNKRNTLINRADTFDFKKKILNKNDMFESPYNITLNRFNSNNIDLKRNSLQIASFHRLSNKVVKKFESSINSKEEPNKNSSNNSTNKLTNINDFFIKNERINSLERRKTAISVLNNINKDLSDFNRKKLKFKIIANNEILSSLKEKEENSLYSSKSSSEEKSKSDIKNKDKKIKFPLDKKNCKQKSEYIIKEEDENNMSEITEDYNKKRSSIINKKNSIIINMEKSKGNKAIIIEQKIQNNEEIKKEEVNKKEVKEREINTDPSIDNKSNIICNNQIRKTSNYDKIENQKEKSNILQINKNELKDKMKKENERNNTISIISINEMFMNQNINNKHKQKINSPKNYLYAITLENNYIRKNKIS